MNITNEIKAKVFAQYLGQYRTISSDENTLDKIRLWGDDIDWILRDDLDRKLILKPLSAITDEDVIGVAKELGLGDFKDTEGFIKAMKEGENLKVQKMLKNVFAYQYLQSKGYDLPNYLLGSKTLHEAGLAIYETEK